MTKLYLGIDPGVLGGFAILGESDRRPRLLVKMPETEEDIYRKILAFADITSVVIEEIPTAIFGADKSSGAKLYGSYARLRMALVACQIAFTAVSAKVWQAEIGVKRKTGESSSKWKTRLKAKAQEMFPGSHITKETSDALLIAEYCRRKGT